MFQWLNKGCICIAVLFGESDFLLGYKDILCDFVDRNHHKVQGGLTKSKGALL